MPSYDSGTGRTLADLIFQRGQQQAAYLLDRGQSQARAWGQAGDAISGAVDSWRQSVERNRQLALEQQRETERQQASALQRESATLALGNQKRQAAQQERADKGAQLVRDVLPLAQRQDGVVGYDRDVIKRELEAGGQADLVPQVFAQLDEQDAAHFKVLEARRDAVAGDAFRLLQSGGDERAYNSMIARWEANDSIPAAELDAMREAGADPQARQRALMAAVASSPRFKEMLKRDDPIKVNKNERLIDPRTGEVILDASPDEAKPTIRDGLFNGQPATVSIGPDGTVTPIDGLRPIPPRDPQGPQPSYQAKEVIGNDGVPVMANFDSRTGRYVGPDSQPIANPRPVPSASETADGRKFQQAGPILDAVEEISARINTQAGLLAKMSGGVEKIKAKANYDDDVAEYQALVSGFTPLVARALGHTGVLTEQDVQSVRELFPKPGESKTLRDRKIARIRSIVGQLQGQAPEGAAAPAGPKPAASHAAPAPAAGQRTIGRFVVVPEGQ